VPANDRSSPAAAPPDALGSRTRRDLRLSTTDAMLFTVMLACGETYFVPFALATGVSESVAAVLPTLPMLVGALAQLASPWFVRRLGSHKKWVVLAAGAHAAVFLPMAAAAFLGGMPTWLLFLVVSFYWTANLAGGPAWNTWIGTVVPKPIRPTYFAKRARASQITQVLGLFAVGFTLHELKEQTGGTDLWVYGVLFLAAGLARAGSTYCHTQVSEPEPMPSAQKGGSVGEFLRQADHRTARRLMLYLLTVTACVQLSGGLFGPYMLKELEFSYLTFTVLMSCSFIGRILTMPLAGRLAKAAGPKSLLLVGGLGIIPLSAIWMVSPDPAYLIVVQLLSGALWACYELSTQLLMLEAIPSKHRTAVLTVNTVVSAFIATGGGLCGAFLLHWLGEDTGAYHAIFLISGALRLFTIPLLLLIHVPKFRVRIPVFRVLSIRPQFGAVVSPALPSIDDENPDENPDDAADAARPAPRNGAQPESAADSTAPASARPLDQPR
jgi:MFS family permease